MTLKLNCRRGAAALCTLTAGAVLGLGLAAWAPLSAQPEQDAQKQMEDEMAMWAAAAQPGEHHRALQPLIGDWDATTRFWMAPDAPPMEGTGSQTNEWVLGERYLKMDFESDFMGAPFHGLGYVGYNNIEKRYESTWMDNMNTMIMKDTGKREGNTITFNGEHAEPTGKRVKTKTVWRISGPDRHVLEMWAAKDGSEMYKSGEITYTRRK